MISPREWQQITRLVQQMATVILSGNTADTQIGDVVGTESIDNLYPGHPTIENRPVAHPYGLMSRAPKGTVQVTARQGEHPANRLVLLHRDKDRPAVADGDVWLYDHHGNQVKLEAGKVVMKLAGNLELGEGATKGVARVQDPVAAATALVSFTSAVATYINAIAPGTVTPLTQGQTCGTISQGSSKVTCTD